ncbi:hypothetical protein HYPSUDRAFT_57651 [Hypholoma sublateritium FD-334 SS-4]|uniref:MYND-type domain-containing protein n=1 Tax=Hypholoma sublateritium (strain FD-334 SS-4) TaxID=945553 RepID=A0A0D2M389_HYPSF|nr:hypothetical protein HYPSUDRAFT_57651 [Hypholoma sublateritium FD-334 SS-4]
MPQLTDAARQMKQCQACFKSDPQAAPLACCALCKRAHYCSEACQIAAWPSHKAECNTQQADRTQMKGERIVSSTAPRGISKSDMEAVILKWIQRYKPLLFHSMVNALELYDQPERGLRNVLFLKLSPTFTAKKLPRRAQVSRAFELADVDIFDIDQFIQTAPPRHRTRLISLRRDIVPIRRPCTRKTPRPWGSAWPL